MWGLRAMQRVNASAPWVTLASNMSVFAFEDLAPTVMSNVLDVVLLDPHWYGGIHRAKLAGQICEAMGVTGHAQRSRIWDFAGSHASPRGKPAESGAGPRLALPPSDGRHYRGRQE